MHIESIGKINVAENGFSIQLNKKIIPGIKGLEGFSHLQIIWWAHLTDKPEIRNNLVVNKLFKRGPEQTGVFATRSPSRPNPIMISTIKVKNIDFEKGIITTPFIDAESGSPLLDIKPYHPMDRVKDCQVPHHRQHWPQWFEEAATFDWKNEINGI